MAGISLPLDLTLPNAYVRFPQEVSQEVLLMRKKKKGGVPLNLENEIASGHFHRVFVPV